MKRAAATNLSKPSDRKSRKPWSRKVLALLNKWARGDQKLILSYGPESCTIQQLGRLAKLPKPWTDTYCFVNQFGLRARGSQIPARGSQIPARLMGVLR
jgi:hypothetical protein